MFRDVDDLRQCRYVCILKHTLLVSDIRSMSIQIPYYTNVRALYHYYTMLCYLSLIHTMLLDGFILLESFVTPAGISMGIKLRTEFFSHIMSN